MSSLADNTAETPDSLSDLESRLADLRAEAADAAKHESEWSKTRAIKKGSALSEYVDDALSSFLTRRVEESARDTEQLERQLARMKVQAETRELQRRIAENQAKLKAL